MSSLPIPLTTVDGVVSLESAFELRSPSSAVVVCHPHPAFGGRLDTPLIVALADALAARGLSTLRFNFRGLGRSEGRPTGGLLEHEDVLAAVAALRAQGMQRVGLVGYSFGALMASRAVARGAAVDALVAIALPTSVLGDDPERLADLERAARRGVPTRFVHGDSDPFVQPALLAGLSNAGRHLRVDLLAQQGHFFEGPSAASLCATTPDFIVAALAP
jgi:alpha/beta superfamily hydrolase